MRVSRIGAGVERQGVANRSGGQGFEGPRRPEGRRLYTERETSATEARYGVPCLRETGEGERIKGQMRRRPWVLYVPGAEIYHLP